MSRSSKVRVKALVVIALGGAALAVPKESSARALMMCNYQEPTDSCGNIPFTVRSICDACMLEVGCHWSASLGTYIAYCEEPQ
jgi:hypothetical protein